MAEPEGSSPLSKKALKEGIRDVLGAGSDIDAANPLVVTPGAAVFNVTADVTDRALRILGRAELNLNGALVSAMNPLPVQTTIPLGTLIYSDAGDVIVGGMNILPAGQQTTAILPVTWRIYVSFQAAGVFAVRRIVGGVTYTERMNAGGNLAVLSAYSFDIIVEPGDTIQLAYSVGTTMDTLKIVELRGAV